MQVYILLQLGLENIWDFSPISDKTLHTIIIVTIIITTILRNSHQSMGQDSYAYASNHWFITYREHTVANVVG
jgi:hypothetical protein